MVIMTDIETADELYSFYITLDNNLLILRERVKRIEDISNKGERIKECEGLYEAHKRIEFIAQKLLSISNRVAPTICQQKLENDISRK